MSNIIDYMKWRGDLSFKQDGFNQIDALILSELVYVDFHNIVDSDTDNSITLEKASEIFFETHSDEEIEEKFFQMKISISVMKEMAKTARFSNILLSNYIDDINTDIDSQFSAMTITLDDGSIFIAYRGTDDTLAGWKENLNMTYLSFTPAQKKATLYLENNPLIKDKKLRLGGHSKGGNLAIYAAINSNEAIRNQILEIYNNDGPGFITKNIDMDTYNSMLPKICSIIPESSIVGMLLEHEEEHIIVASNKSGIYQHDATNWKVEGKSFIEVDNISMNSKIYSKSIKSWLNKLDLEKREQFINTLFSVFEENDIHSLNDFKTLSPEQFFSILNLLSETNKDNDEILSSTMSLLIAEGTKTIKKEVKKIFNKDNNS